MFGVALLVILSNGVTLASGQWQVVDYLIDNFAFLPNMSFSAGDMTGRKHTFEKGSLKMNTPIIMASSSKFPAAIAITGAVVDGYLSFDTAVHEVFDWWTSDSKDKRSKVTLRHLLTFTSGLVSSDFAGCGMRCLTLANASWYDPEECAREIYEEGAFGIGAFWADPGTIWSYHSLHLQVAGAMAAKAAGLSIQGLLEKYLIKRLGMQSTYWAGYPNPHLAASMITTGDDYDTLLQAVLTYTIAPKEIIDEMEMDAYRTYPGLVPSPYPKDTSLGFYGHYSMCTYFECVDRAWSEQCELEGIHADPGAFGYWPLIDRSKGYYMQLVVFRPVQFNQTIMEKYHLTQDSLAALPGHCTSPLRFEVQYFVEKAMGKASLGDASRTNTSAKDDPLAFFCKLAEDTPSSVKWGEYKHFLPSVSQPIVV